MIEEKEIDFYKRIPAFYSQKSPIDSIIIDLVLEHFNHRSLAGAYEDLTSEEFFAIVEQAHIQYVKDIEAAALKTYLEGK
jgi:hypothetical protein|tara:strand:- start:118 stop:357 length:240 start_codon:yes stop_codon:yes gene_type:complete